MIKKIYILDYKKDEELLLDEIVSASTESGIETEVLMTDSNLLIDLSEDESKIVVSNNAIDISQGSFFFARNYGANSAMSSLLAYFLEKRNAKYSFGMFSKKALRSSKYFQYLYLKEERVSIPETILGSVNSVINNISYINEKIGFPLVMKANGSKGDYVFLVNKPSEITKIMNDVENKRKEVISIQKVVDCGYDIRIIFYKNEVLSAMKRSSESFLNNYNKGGKTEKYFPTEKDIEISRKALKNFGMDYVAIDLMHDKDELPIILEIQVGPWTHGMRSAHGNLNLGKQIVEQIKKKT